MPLIQGSLSDFQPIVEVVVGRSANDGERYRALIDTGATQCCISRSILEHHRLDYRTKLLIQTAGSPARRERAYAFSLGLPCRTGLDGPPTFYVWPDELIAPAILDTSSFDVILGMSFLSRGRLVFERGSFCFEFGQA